MEDAPAFGQRPKIDGYDDFTYMVVHGAPRSGQPHHRGPLRGGRAVCRHRPPGELLGPVRRPGPGWDTTEPSGSPRPLRSRLLYLIIDQLVDTFFPYLNTFDNQIDELRGRHPGQPDQPAAGHAVRHEALTGGGAQGGHSPAATCSPASSPGWRLIPGVNDEGQRYIRDLYDHLIRISDLVDSYRDLLSGTLDTHLSTVSNKLNVVMKQLTIIATISLPLSFLTGFFGQNFSVARRPHHRTGATFLVFAIGLEIVCALGLLAYFRKGWLGKDTA